MCNACAVDGPSNHRFTFHENHCVHPPLGNPLR